MKYYLTWYFIWKALALVAAGATVYCLWQVSPWAVSALFPAVLFLWLDSIGEWSFKQHLGQKALEELARGSAAHAPTREKP